MVNKKLYTFRTIFRSISLSLSLYLSYVVWLGV